MNDQEALHTIYDESANVIVDEDTGEVIEDITNQKPERIDDVDDQPVSDEQLRASLDSSDMTGVQKIPMSLGISENDTRKGKEFCKEIIQTVLDAKLPKDMKNKPELLRLVQLQSSFEEFTLQGMFMVVAQAVRLLNQLTSEDAIYTPEGLVDTFKLQAVLNTQQHAMNLLQQFNLHVRRLPGVLSDMLRDIEYSQIITVEATEVKQENYGGNVTSKSMAQLMLEAKESLANEPEPAPNEEPEQPVDVNAEHSPVDDVDNEDIDLS